jgi:hypothetical protein
MHEIETEIKQTFPPKVAHSASDLTEITPQLARVLIDNSRVRVVDLRGDEGQHFATHLHPYRVSIRLTNARVKVTAQDGTMSLVDYHAGEAQWATPVEHQDEVVLGDFHNLMVEIKAQ